MLLWWNKTWDNIVVWKLFSTSCAEKEINKINLTLSWILKYIHTNLLLFPGREHEEGEIEKLRWYYLLIIFLCPDWVMKKSHFCSQPLSCCSTSNTLLSSSLLQSTLCGVRLGLLKMVFVLPIFPNATRQGVVRNLPGNNTTFFFYFRYTNTSFSACCDTNPLAKISFHFSLL